MRLSPDPTCPRKRSHFQCSAAGLCESVDVVTKGWFEVMSLHIPERVSVAGGMNPSSILRQFLDSHQRVCNCRCARYVLGPELRSSLSLSFTYLLIAPQEEASSYADSTLNRTKHKIRKKQSIVWLVSFVNVNSLTKHVTQYKAAFYSVTVYSVITILIPTRMSVHDIRSWAGENRDLAGDVTLQLLIKPV